MGGAGHKMAHNVFVWDRESGTLVKVMEGPKESLIDCDVSGRSGGCGYGHFNPVGVGGGVSSVLSLGKGEAVSAGDT